MLSTLLGAIGAMRNPILFMIAKDIRSGPQVDDCGQHVELQPGACPGIALGDTPIGSGTGLYMLALFNLPMLWFVLSLKRSGQHSTANGQAPRSPGAPGHLFWFFTFVRI